MSGVRFQPTMVVKLGTEALRADGSERLSQAVFNEAARQIASVRKMGIGVIVVSSGAIQAGKDAHEGAGLSWEGLEAKDISGVGSFCLGRMWFDALVPYSLIPGMVWVTYANWRNRGERRRISRGISSYLARSVVPIVNENDFVSSDAAVDEIRKMKQGISENDHLACMIADLAKAGSILYLTSVGWVYEGFEDGSPVGRRYAELDAGNLPAAVLEAAAKSKAGKGGMAQKAKVAAECARGGRRAAIAGLQDPDVIIRFAAGKAVGTMIGEENRCYS